jgi:peptide/nickel transport system ATP-binding protein
MPSSTRGCALPSQDNPSLLEVRGLSVSFRTERGLVCAVDNISFRIGEREIVGVVGESGSGKTVSLMSVMGLINDPNAVIEGSIVFKGRELHGLSKRALRSIRGREIAMIFQDPMTALTPVYTIGWQICEQLRAHNKMSKRAARQRAVELLDAVGIAHPAVTIDRYPHQLSGGMRQRAFIAMALSCNPSLLIADEPTTALDVTVQAQILELIQRLRRDFGSSIILITHDLGVVAEVADRVMVMYAGRIVERGTTRQIFTQPWHP